VIDVRRLRDDPEYRRGIERKRVRAAVIDEVLAADRTRRVLVHEVETRRARQNAASREIGQATPDERPAKIEVAAALKEELAAKEKELQAADASFREAALQLPNPAHPSVPDGGEDEGQVLRTIGEPTRAPALDHAAFSDRIGFVDTAHAAEASGTRFAYIMREAALLELALVNYSVRTVVEHGFTPVVTPALVRARTMEEAGFFPTDRSQVYEVDEGELFLIGTSEVALSALHRAETLTPDLLPARYAGLSPCF
jgi:seryl-tRNA synthetase